MSEVDLTIGKLKRCRRTSHLKAYDSVAEARTSIGRYLTFYKTQRPHSSLDRRTPDQAYSSRSRNARQRNPGRRST
jgi:transposase InsO family protein